MGVDETMQKSDMLFEQYKLYLEGAEKISYRRENANKHFITINSIIIVAGTFLIEHLNNKDLLIFLLICVLTLGIIICIIFYFLINSYKQLNTAKFELIHKIENKLPLQLYSEEWNILGEGKDKSRYFPFSHIERFIPFVFGVVYVLSILFLIIWLCFIRK